MQRFHMIFGGAAFVLFLITGQLMIAHFPEKESMDQALRLLTRSRHIYILFSALLHLALGIYFKWSSINWLRRIQTAGSILLTLGTVLLSAAFFVESYSSMTFTIISAVGIFLAFGGVALHLSGLSADTAKS